jgi:predicted aminopeptidase
MRFLASWALVHETADEGWKSAVARGNAQEPGDMDAGSEAFVDGLSAIIAERKEQLKAELAAGADGGDASRAGVSEHLDELRFEVAELRGRFESMQASLDAILERTKDASGAESAGKA